MRNFIGYTLIEILVGISILGILFSVGYASFREFSRRQALDGASKGVRGDLRLAQSQALSGQSQGCTSPLGGYNFTVTSGTNYQIKPSCTGPVSVKSVNLPAGITFKAPLPPAILFKVLGQGTNISAGGSVVITLVQAGTNKQVLVTITDGGEIK